MSNSQIIIRTKNVYINSPPVIEPKPPVSNPTTDENNFDPTSITFYNFSTPNKREVHLVKQRWSEIIPLLIEICSFTKEHIIKILEDSVVFGKVNGNFVVPERNGWVYISYYDISVKIMTSNRVIDMAKRLVKNTPYENKIGIVLGYGQQNRVITI